MRHAAPRVTFFLGSVPTLRHLTRDVIRVSTSLGKREADGRSSSASNGCCGVCVCQRAGRELPSAHDLDRAEIVCVRPLPLQAEGEDPGDLEHVLLEAECEAVTLLA
jgi:hypothetical protein